MNVNDAVILDRSWTPRLALDQSNIPEELRAWLRQANMIAVESGGASALINHLEDLDVTRGKLYLVRSKDLPQLSEESAQALRARIAAIGKTQPVVSALRTYRVESGRMSDSDERVLGYIFRLMLLAAGLNAGLLLWASRYLVLREVLSVSGIEFQEEKNGSLTSLCTVETSFPFADSESILPRTIRASVLHDDASATVLASAQQADQNNDALPPINVGIGGPTIDLIAWGRYLKKKLRRKTPGKPPATKRE